MTYPEFDLKFGYQYHEAMRRAHQEHQAQQESAAYQERFNQERLHRKYEALFESLHRQSFRSDQGYHTPSPQIANGHWSTVLAVSPQATVSEIKSAYRKLARTAHPDAGGSAEAMSRLNAARDQALKERNAK